MDPRLSPNAPRATAGPAAAPAPTTGAPPQGPVYSGDAFASSNSFDLVASDMQFDLAALGFYQTNPTGRLDSDTRAALSRFQFANGLPSTGLPDAPTIQALNAAVDALDAPRA